jgi:F-type H+-transporting ATPase subunit delta
MSEFRAAHRYALAMISVAEETKALEKVNKEFEWLNALISQSHEFFIFLKSPVVNTEKKKRVLTEILQGKVSDLTMKFVVLLASKGREGLLPEITRQFFRLRDERLGILNVTAKTAVPFTGTQEKQLSDQLEHVTKKKIRMNYIIDPSLKGGFTVQHDDTVWDASVRRQLELLRERFTEAAA